MYHHVSPTGGCEAPASRDQYRLKIVWIRQHFYSTGPLDLGQPPSESTRPSSTHWSLVELSAIISGPYHLLWVVFGDTLKVETECCALCIDYTIV